MKVTNTSFTDFLKKAGCFEIPSFQRNYVWSLKQWQQLFDDVLSLSRYEKMKKHFLGTVSCSNIQNKYSQTDRRTAENHYVVFASCCIAEFGI